jgi:hypothetical protein
LGFVARGVCCVLLVVNAFRNQLKHKPVRSRLSQVSLFLSFFLSFFLSYVLILL